jgi:ribosomal protein L19E
MILMLLELLVFFVIIYIITSNMKPAGQNIRKLVKDGFIIKKPQKIHSRSRARRAHEAKQKGRHSGYGMFML